MEGFLTVKLNFIVFYQSVGGYLFFLFKRRHSSYFFNFSGFGLVLFLFFMHTLVLTIPNAKAQIDGSSHIQVYDGEKEFTDNESEFHKNIDQIPDGQDLLLRPKVGSLIYEFDVYALKKNETIYFSLMDIIDILEIAVDFDWEGQKGKGWFLREDWLIDIDLNSGVVRSKGNEIHIKDTDYIDVNGYIYVSQEALGHWLDMEFTSDIGQQYLEINSPYPLPGVARAYRQQRGESRGTVRKKAELPRYETQYDWFDINTADVRLGTRYRRVGKSKGSKAYNAGVAAQGQVLKHEAYVLADADNRNNISSIRARLSRRDENSELLGPLKARSYAFGDVDVTDIPLTGDAQQELGFRVSNSTVSGAQFETTDISGDSLPDWDVELYRNGVLSGSVTVDGSGRYEFSDVQLFAGENLFEIFFYGPQGEIRSKSLNVPVSTALLTSQDGTYDISISFSDTQTYRPLQIEDQDHGGLHVSARYNKVIGDALGYIGVRSRDVDGEKRTFVSTGATKLIANTIVDINAGVDDDANAAAQVVARKNIHDWNVALSGKVQDRNYAPDGSANPRVYEVSGNAQRSLNLTERSRSNVSGRIEYGEVASGDKSLTARWSSSHQFGSYNISNSTFYENLNPKTGENTDRLDNTLSVRANMGKVFVRGGIDYDVKPEAQIDRYFSQVSYRPNAKISGDLYLDHEPDRNFSEARLNVNYTHEKFRASPFVEVDSDDEIYTGVNLNFNVIDSPNDDKPIITSDRTIGRSMVSAFVYHDKNGDLKFNGDDEPLPDVVVESLNIRRRAKTNEDGYSLIKDLSGMRATDITVDEQTLPDPFMIVADRGVSILPSAGEIVELEFPIHMAGEIDGTVSIRDDHENVDLLKGGDVILYPLRKGEENPIKAPIAYDGFYIATKIPPGQYLMSVSDDTLYRMNAAAPAPKMVNIGYGGDVIYGHNIEIQAEKMPIPLEVVYGESDNERSNKGAFLSVGGQKKSELGAVFSKFVERSVPESLFSGLEVFDTLSDGSTLYYMAENKGVEQLYQQCSLMQSYALDCAVHIWPEYLRFSQETSTTEK